MRLGCSAWAVFRLTALLPDRARQRALLGAAEAIIDLAVPVDPERDHVRGPVQALVTLVEYGDYECPYCGQAEPVVRELLADYGDLSYVWRHLPLTDVHPHAGSPPRRAEAAARQGAFWPMHDLLLAHQDALTADYLIRYAAELGLDAGRFTADLRDHAGATRDRRGRRLRRPERRIRHADVLHQRQAPSRRVRHRHADRSGAGSQDTGTDQLGQAAPAHILTSSANEAQNALHGSRRR